MVEEKGKLRPQKGESNIDSSKVQQWEVRYTLLESTEVNDMVQVRQGTVDNLETHNFYKNQDGVNQQIQNDNKIKYAVKIVRNPQDVIKTVIVPLLILMFLSLATSAFGDPVLQLANLIAVYLAYGQFLIVMNDKTIDQKE